MSQENVDFVLNGYARANAGERVPQLDFWHEDAEYHTAPRGPRLRGSSWDRGDQTTVRKLV